MAAGESKKAKATKQWPIQRRHARHRADLTVTLRYRDRSGAVSNYAHCTDLNLGGLSAYLPADLLTGTPVEVELTLPGTHNAVRFGALILNRNMYRYGMEWSALTDEQRRELRESCEWLAKQQAAQ